ncbi:MAG: ferrous iron transport protein A [Firmicutes bacterium]|nr:ferrous iron transport protein A [Bacillota bacterium]
MTLAQVNVGEHAVIDRINGYGPLRRRLLEMGLTPNTVVCVRKMAPMGDPIELIVRGYSLTLRKEDAQLIEVNNITQAPPVLTRGRGRGFGWRRRHGGRR